MDKLWCTRNQYHAVNHWPAIYTHHGLLYYYNIINTVNQTLILYASTRPTFWCWWGVWRNYWHELQKLPIVEWANHGMRGGSYSSSTETLHESLVAQRAITKGTVTGIKKNWKLKDKGMAGLKSTQTRFVGIITHYTSLRLLFE